MLEQELGRLMGGKMLPLSPHSPFSSYFRQNRDQLVQPVQENGFYSCLGLRPILSQFPVLPLEILCL